MKKQTFQEYRETPAMRINKRKSSITSLKEIIFIVSAVTISTTFFQIAPSFKGNLSNALGSREFFLTILLILNIVRFSHGNIRLLDDTYMYPTEYSDDGGHESVDRKTRVWVDFIGCLTMTVLFAFLAYVVEDYLLFFQVFALVLFTDVLWFFFTGDYEAPPTLRTVRNKWFWNNGFFLAGIGLIVMLHYFGKMKQFENYDLTFIALTIVVTINTMFDYVLNWNFYFPGSIRHKALGKLHVFLAGPFSKLLDNDDNFDNDAKKYFQAAIEALKAHDIEYYSAHSIEKWGKSLRPSKEALEADIRAVQSHDVFIALVFGEVSQGTLVELGVAISHKKKIVICLIKNYQLPYLLEDIQHIHDARIVTFNGPEDLKSQLNTILPTFKINF